MYFYYVINIHLRHNDHVLLLCHLSSTFTLGTMTMYSYYVFKLYMNIVWCFVEVEYDISINYKTQVV
jgi:hypothetical protein